MQKYLDYAKQINNAGEDVLFWIEHTLKNYVEKNDEVQDEIEHVIDYLTSDKAPQKIRRMSYPEAKSNAAKWTKSQQKKGNGIEESKNDTEVILDFKDGFKVVKLVGENAYKREGFLMNHCVGGYFGNGKEIYSLRDRDNMPHCTMEKDQQIKGKGNGDIHPKYVDYVVRFLEHSGMSVRDSEMSHLGYEVVPFGKYATIKCYRDRYVPKGMEVKYQNGVRFFDSKVELGNYMGNEVALFRGDLIIEEEEKFVAKSLCEVSGSVYVSKDATFTAPKLAEISGYVDVSKDATFTAPKLAEISGSVDVRESATFTAPKLEKSGSVYVRESATFTAPKLEKSGYVDVRESATFYAPLMGYDQKPDKKGKKKK